ncbi:hypothetical protein A3D88_02180 [Candidatus Peribacteria bacterium RIFCSPHIGHO2_02_FULL_52_16]|nr:MAG: hypothetical protein A2706_02765 [Candidatus Peribacteria bacterium RIFCSPHIGHO2_01_FULL_51_35]OGJ61465.1 MAG: hypothetical protein A3D88_02180 [Candidatus Peribacteria bacterium RIFCSPHIGHO2_02_FULL_52_16]
MDYVDTLPVAEESAAGRFIVLFKNKEMSAGGMEATMKKFGVRNTQLQFTSIKGFAGKLSDATVLALRNDPDVALVEPDRVVYAFSHTSPPQTLPTGIDRIDADVSPTAMINGVDERVNADIAIIDTGVQKSHPDLNVFKQVRFTRELSSDDRNGHGTHVAGTAAAKDNTVGVVGVAPGARIWSVKVLDRNGSGLLSDVVAGIDYVTANAASIEVANMSLGCECVSAAMDLAISRAVAAGVTVVVAAGNSAKDAATFSPANHPDVLAVSAIADFNGLPGGGAPATCRSDVDDSFANFSNFGAVVDIAAPGVCIRSTWKGSSYATISGTSMASPHAAGAAALYIAVSGKPTDAAGVAAVRNALIAAGSVQSGSGGFVGDPDVFAEPVLNVKSF